MMTTHRTQAILFDMDGLLFDSEATLKRIWQAEADRLGFDLHDGLYADLVGVPNAICEEKLVHWFSNFPLQKFRVAWRAAREAERLEGGVPPKPGAREMLEWLASQGMPLGLATSSSRAAVQRNLQAYPDIFRFDVIVTIEDVTRPKPDPDIYHQACAKLGVEAESCVIFEDSNPGMRAAIASGARAIMIPDLARPEPEVLAGANRLYPSLTHALSQRHEWL